MKISYNKSTLLTDDDIRMESKKHIDDFLTKKGESGAEALWNEMQKMLKKSLGNLYKPPSPAEKRKFVKESGLEHKRIASKQERQEAEDRVFNLIKKDMAVA